MTHHPLDPLLKPGSVALVGASARQSSPGNILANLVINSSFAGTVYPINPNAEQILGKTCYPDLDSLPETVDHVVLAVSNERIESMLRAAIEHGAKAATIYASCVLEKDDTPSLKQRLEIIARHAGIAICGANCMGFYSITHSFYAGVFPMPGEMPKGSISFIAQSGSAFAALAHNGVRLKFNLCVSSGNEFVTAIHEYMDWSLAQPETKVIALFLESVRNPDGFMQVLEKARDQNIPVVVMKVGKSPLGAEMANTHTGAIAGSHTAFKAVFRKYGVIEASGFDDMAAILMLLQSGNLPGDGKLCSIQESGGLMELATDICDQIDLPFAKISDETKAEIARHLDPGLKPDNPLDAWGSNEDFENRFYACFSAMMKDPAVAVGLFICNFRDGYYLSEAFVRIMQRVKTETDKPIAMVNCYSDIANTNLVERATSSGIPMIDDLREGLNAVKVLFFCADRMKAQTPALTQNEENRINQTVVEKWKTHFASASDNQPQSLSEVNSLALLEDFGIPTPQRKIAHSLEEALATAIEIGYPIVLKTAEQGIDHKSDQHGVVTNIADDSQLIRHYQDMSARLGTAVLISQQVEAGTEIGLGIINDPQFGLMVMVSAGGVLIELLAENAVALAPVDKKQAEDLIKMLRVNRLLDGIRGRPSGHKQGLIDIIIKLSIIAIELRDEILEVDINPVIVNRQSAVAVDGLIVRKSDH